MNKLLYTIRLETRNKQINMVTHGIEDVGVVNKSLSSPRRAIFGSVMRCQPTSTIFKTPKSDVKKYIEFNKTWNKVKT